MGRGVAFVVLLCGAGCGGNGRAVGGLDAGHGLGAECTKLANCCGGDSGCIGFLTAGDEVSCKLAQPVYCARDLAMSSTPEDLAVAPVVDLATRRDFSTSGPDLAMPLLIGCMDLIACTNACTTMACLTKCHGMATAQANMLLQVLDDCITARCVTAPDSGVAPCGSGGNTTACNTCVMNTQSGTSPTGISNGTCAPNNDPVCGLCVDPLIACANDLTL